MWYISWNVYMIQNELKSMHNEFARVLARASARAQKASDIAGIASKPQEWSLEPEENKQELPQITRQEWLDRFIQVHR